MRIKPHGNLSLKKIYFFRVGEAIKTGSSCVFLQNNMRAWLPFLFIINANTPARKILDLEDDVLPKDLVRPSVF